MTRFRCDTCGGEYDDTAADGTPYAHVCPPVTRVRVRRDGQELDIELAELREGEPELARWTIERPEGRDENPNPHDRDERQRARIRRRGRGRTAIGPGA